MEPQTHFLCNEKRDFLRNRRGRHLFYALHTPIRTSAPVADDVWIFCNPFIEEKVFSHGVYVQFARFLAGNGYTVLRFDYEGDGDSEGEYHRMDLLQWRDDVLDMMDLVMRLFPRARINLFGLRLGAAIAAFAAQKKVVHALLFWEPIFNGEKYMSDCLKINLTSHFFSSRKSVKDGKGLIESLRTAEMINLFGYEINDRLFDQIQRFDLKGLLKPLAGISRIAAVAINRPGLKADRAEVLECASDPEWFALLSMPTFWYGPRMIDMKPDRLFTRSHEIIQAMNEFRI